jgi:L-lactate dehydrogenase complex protein LldG
MAGATEAEVSMSESANQLNRSPARDAILGSVRDNLAASARMNLVVAEGKHDAPHPVTEARKQEPLSPSIIEMFQQHLELVGGHCIVVANESDAAQALGQTISALRSQTPARIALSDSPVISRLIEAANLPVEIQVTPDQLELFQYDAGVTMAQAAIAETGTLVLESDFERHRLVSLVPPVHIAIVNAEDICRTLGEAFERLRRGPKESLSRVVTFITGPSRTADIELTLTVGVHGPKELHVILNTGPRL